MEQKLFLSYLFLVLSSTAVNCRSRRGQTPAWESIRTTTDDSALHMFPDTERDGGQSERDSSAIPDFVRVEVEVQRLENADGILATGKKCDFFKSCDPKVYAFLDNTQPLSPFPGPVAVSKWLSIFEASNTNSPTIGKSVNKDVCGGSLSTINLRVHIVDVDTFSANDDIMNFDCLFTVDPRDISQSALTAQWGPSMECRAAGQAGKIRLFTRQRAYQIPTSDCRADGNDQIGSLTQSTQPLRPRPSEIGSERMREIPVRRASGHIAGQHDFIHIDVELVQLLDPQGIADNGKKCDSSSACDPKISAFLDTEKPLAAWPGSKTVPEYITIFKRSNQNSPVINKNVSTNICGGAVKNLNLRVHVVDGDTLGHDDLMANFQCLFIADYSQVAPDVSSADWSPTTDCSPLNPKNDIRLQYRFRLYDILPTQCGIRSTGH